MSTNQNTALARRPEQGLERRAAAVAEVERISKEATALFVQAAKSFAAELAVARSISQMREALSEEVMQDIMALQGTSLGFRSDKNYPVEVVRDVFIESRMRGFRVVGNEFNIIAGKFYGTKEGYGNRVREWPGLTDLREIYSTPRVMDGGAVVACKATWKVNGAADSVDFTGEAAFAVRLTSGQGADAALGKAERRLMARIYKRLSGINTPDGDVDDNGAIEVSAQDRATRPPVPQATGIKSTSAPVAAPQPAPIDPADDAFGSAPVSEQSADEAAVRQVLAVLEQMETAPTQAALDEAWGALMVLKRAGSLTEDELKGGTDKYRAVRDKFKALAKGAAQ